MVNCVPRVQSALESVAGVTSVEVSLPDRAEVKGTASPGDLIAAVERAGYKASVR
ncbi:MAG: cation transporter [Verrucomicrobiales bacterium]|nr:cation transporter [Verrucomicrobiales bacterium]